MAIRNAINAGDFPGPRMTAASPEMTVTGGLGDMNLWHKEGDSFAIVCDGPEAFRQTARMMCREGVDTLKINPSGDEFLPLARAHMTVMNDAEVAAVAEVAQAFEKRFASHARSAGSVKLSLRHGCDVIYHATLCDEEALDMLEAAKDRVFVAPTLGITYTTIHEAAEFGLTKDVVAELGFQRELDIAVE
ncbi:MAG: amidohydrolase family protein, partial [Alphaproteobacteria bacterium]